MAQTAFNAKFRIVDNNSDRENAPERNLIIDISVDEAMKMANWLQTMVDNAHIEDTKIRVYKSKSDYDENQISRKDYNTILDLLNNKYEEVSS